MTPTTDQQHSANDVAAVATACPRRRLKLWELPTSLHGPLLGVCLTGEALVELAARHGISAAGNDEFEFHGKILEALRERGPAAEALQRHLDRTHKLWVDRFALLADADAIMDKWRRSVRQGEIAGPLWAASTHRAISAAALQCIDRDIRALSCRLDLRQITDSHRLAHLEAENARLQDELCRLKIRHAGELDALRQQVAGLQHAALESGKPERNSHPLSPRSLGLRPARVVQNGDHAERP